MATVTISKGLLKNIELEEMTPETMIKFAASGQTELKRISFFNQKLSRVTYRNVIFEECGFGRTRFDSVKFVKCTFRKIDLTRGQFANCYFSGCTFTDCDAYYVSFPRSIVAPASFKDCYKLSRDTNKALLLFSALRKSFKNSGNARLAGAADYYYRGWERKLLRHRWTIDTSSCGPWLWSWFLNILNGYGERPVYLLFWILGLVTLMSFVYRHWFPYAVGPGDASPLSYWRFSLSVFCAQGFSNSSLTPALLLSEVAEFTFGLVLISVLVGSVSRKLSANNCVA